MVQNNACTEYKKLSDYLTREEHSELMLDLNSRFKLTSLKLDKVVKDSRASQETVQKMQADLEVKIGKVGPTFNILLSISVSTSLGWYLIAIFAMWFLLLHSSSFFFFF